METIGWMSIDGIKGKAKKHLEEIESRASMSFERRYIDNNLFGFHYHTGLNDSTFPTEHGQNVSKSIHQARKALKLDHSYGCAPKDLWLNRAPYPSNDSLLTWLENEVLPDIVINKERKDIPRLAIANSGTMRFDVFKGAFTRDTTYIISPFVSKFLYIKDVPYKAAKALLPLLNNGGPMLESAELRTSQLAPPEQMSITSDFIIPNLQVHDSLLAQEAQSPLMSSDPGLVPGYTTKDDAGDDGDDTLHAPISFYTVPNCLQSALAFPAKGDPDTVDLVFVDFIQPWILLALRFLGQTYNASDVQSYTDETLTDLMADWIKGHWKKDC
jgi:hypothetical protein